MAKTDIEALEREMYGHVDSRPDSLAPMSGLPIIVEIHKSKRLRNIAKDSEFLLSF